MKQFISALLLSSCALTYTSTSVANAYPVTVNDDRGKQVTFEKKLVTLASISVFGADLAHALGKKANGISTLNHKRSAFLGNIVDDMADLGEIHETNMELLTQLDPDLIIGIRAYTEPFEKKFEEIGQFLAYDMVTYQDSINAINSAAAAMGEADKATSLNADFAADLEAYGNKAPGGVSVVFLWHWADVPYAFYDHHMTMMIMSTLKGKNLVGPSPNSSIKKMDSAPISMEKLLQLNPDVIISFKGDDGPVKNHPVWPRLKAVKTGRAYRVNDQFIMSHGPIARDMVLRELAFILYPAVFPKPTDIPVAAQVKKTTFSND